MQRTRVIRQIAITAALAAAVAGIWFFGAWLGNHIPVWGMVVVFAAILVFFIAELWDV